MAEEKPYQRGMVVVAHPDDAEYGCAGTVARWCREGMEVVYVICTDGSKGSSDPEMTPGTLAEIRPGGTAGGREGVGAQRSGILGLRRLHASADIGTTP